MRNRPSPAIRRRPVAAQPPLPHASWSPPVDGKHVTPQEFWQRLGL